MEFVKLKSVESLRLDGLEITADTEDNVVIALNLRDSRGRLVRIRSEHYSQVLHLYVPKDRKAWRLAGTYLRGLRVDERFETEEKAKRRLTELRSGLSSEQEEELHLEVEEVLLGEKPPLDPADPIPF